MLRIFVLFTVGTLVAGPVLADCPPAPDRGDSLGPLLEQLRTAEDPAIAQELSGNLWEVWTTAPDARAQELLDRGMSARAAWDLRGAYDALDQLVAYCPDYAEGYNQRAFVLFLMQEFDSAMPDLDRALELNPEHIGALAGKALTHFGMGEDDAGLEVLRRAIEMNPWLPERGMLREDPGQDI